MTQAGGDVGFARPGHAESQADSDRGLHAAEMHFALGRLPGAELHVRGSAEVVVLAPETVSAAQMASVGADVVRVASCGLIAVGNAARGADSSCLSDAASDAVIVVA